MHREQSKCSMRRHSLPARTETVDPDFSTFTSHLRSARLILLPVMLITAMMDLSRDLLEWVRLTRRDS